jgi:VanZ family protein
MLFPFGFLLALRSNRGSAALATILGTTLSGLIFSLFIETTQFFLPSRNPSASDLLLNTVGAFMGGASAIFALHLLRRWKQLGSLPVDS